MEPNKNPPVIYSEEETDDLELLSELDEHLNDEDISKEENKYADKVSPRVQKLRDLRKKSKVSITQSRPFLAGVELDIRRKHENALLIEDLYVEWCGKGNKTWLSPFEILTKYDEALLLFSGKRSSIAAFIQNLIALSREGISPHAFLRYVQNPRMGADFNWREWSSKHLTPLRLIADTLLELKRSAPFDKEILGTQRVRMARDIVLVKYAGKPLARFSEEALKSSAIGVYMESWAGLRLDNSAFILFLKKNILPILFALSGKVDLPHLNRILSLLPDVERLFRENFKEGYLDSLAKDAPGIYGKDFEKGFQERRNKGYKYYDFIVETESFLKILSALLKTQSGYFLLPWVSNVLVGKKDTNLAQNIAALVDALDDTGGNHTYTWHIRKLMNKPARDREAYITLVRDNNGVDPEYPNIRRIFQNPGDTYETTYLLELARKLGIPLSDFGPKGTVFSFKDLLNAYTKRNPESLEILNRFRMDAITGIDRQWDLQTLAQFDSLGNNVHPLFLRSAIRGLGSNFFSAIKSVNFSNLYSEFSIAKPNSFHIEKEFKIPFYEVNNMDKFKEEEIAKKVNRKLVLSALSPFLTASPVSVDNFVPFLSTESIQLRESLESKTEEQRKLELEIKFLEENEVPDKAILKEKRDSAKKLEKSISFIRDKRTHYEEILSIYHRLSEDEKFLVIILVSGYIADTGSELYSFAVSMILIRYEKETRLAEQLDFLRQDIVAETFNYSQFMYFLSTLELCKNLIQTDKALTKIESESDHRLHGLLRPYIITKNKKLNTESIDASVSKLTSSGKLNSEKSKWQDIIENTEKKVKEKLSPFKLFISKTSLDAYYGDMGGICLANYPAEIKKEGFYINRLIQKDDEMIVGISIAIMTNGGIPSLGIKSYWAAFAFNPLSSLISSYSYRNQLYIYLQYRRILEMLSVKTNLPVVIMGVDTYGIVSNHAGFKDLIVGYEEKKKFPAKRLSDAHGISLYYDENNYRKSILIIDPTNKDTFTAEAAIQYYKYE